MFLGLTRQISQVFKDLKVAFEKRPDFLHDKIRFLWDKFGPMDFEQHFDDGKFDLDEEKDLIDYKNQTNSRGQKFDFIG